MPLRDKIRRHWHHKHVPKTPAPETDLRLSTAAVTKPETETTAVVSTVDAAQSSGSVDKVTKITEFRDLWDEAYEALRKDDPQLIDRYEQILLSRGNDQTEAVEGEPGQLLQVFFIESYHEDTRS